MIQIPQTKASGVLLMSENVIFSHRSLAPSVPLRKTVDLRSMRKGVGQVPPPLRHGTTVFVKRILYVESCIVGTGGLAPPSCDTKTWFA